MAAQDELLADCLDELFLAWRSGWPLDLDAVRERFPAATVDSSLVAFFVRLCACADDWRTLPVEPDATQQSVEAPPIANTAPVPAAAPTIGRYRIIERLAAGGMGTVYRAYDPTLGREVALKIPHLDRDHPRFDELADQFVQEARLAAAVDHPNVCAVHDAGRHDGAPYAVMALVEGTTLSARLKVHPRFDDPVAAADLVRRVAEGLHAAHQRKIVHRDIKPGNILLRQIDGQPVLADFGLARVAQEGAFVTRPGVVAGTVAYMAPEQAAGDSARIGPATDVYGLGAVLYQMVTGSLPHDGDVPSMLASIQTSDPPTPSQLRPGLDPRLDAVIRRAMARDPDVRYRDAGELADALRAFAILPDTSATVTYSAPPIVPTTPAARRRLWWGAGVATLLLVSAVAVVVWLGALRSPAPAAPSLDGELVVRVWTDPKVAEPFARPKVGVAVDDKSLDALPVRNIDLVHLEVRMNRPAYVYVLWFPGEGGPPTALFPWDPAHGFRSVPEQRKVAEVHSPERLDGGWGVKGPSGLETAVLLAKEAALTAEELAELETAIGTLPPTPLGPNVQECAWLWREPAKAGGAWTNRGTLRGDRGIDTEAARDLVDEPVFALLKRMQPKFDLVKAVRFAHVGPDFGAKPKAAKPEDKP